MCLEIIFNIYVYKKDSALNSLQLLMCHKTKQNQTKPSELKPVVVLERDGLWQAISVQDKSHKSPLRPNQLTG